MERKYLEYFDGAFDSTVADKMKPENKPYVAYSKTEGIVFTVIPKPVTGPADNEIWYTTSDRNEIMIVRADNKGREEFVPILPHDEIGDYIITSHEYSEINKCYIITTNKPITEVFFSSMSMRSGDLSQSQRIKSIKLPKSLTVLSNLQGYGISYIDITENVTNINPWALGHTELQQLTIPVSVSYIGRYAFRYTPLVDINYLGTKEQWNSILKEDDWDEGCSIKTIHCIDGDIAL